MSRRAERSKRTAYPPLAPRGDHIADRRIAYVLDASALLAFLREEPGAAMVEAVLETSILSAVNWSEVVQKALAYGIGVDGMQSDLQALGLAVLPFTPEDGEIAGRLWPATKASGLSLGDRACLALAIRFSVPVLTSDHIWKELRIDGIEVELLR